MLSLRIFCLIQLPWVISSLNLHRPFISYRVFYTDIRSGRTPIQGISLDTKILCFRHKAQTKRQH